MRADEMAANRYPVTMPRAAIARAARAMVSTLLRPAAVKVVASASARHSGKRSASSCPGASRPSCAAASQPAWLHEGRKGGAGHDRAFPCEKQWAQGKAAEVLRNTVEPPGLRRQLRGLAASPQQPASQIRSITSAMP